MLKHYIYLPLSVSEAADMVEPDFNLLEAKLTVMQATFLVIQSIPSLNLDILKEGQQIFQILFNHYFTEDMQV